MLGLAAGLFAYGVAQAPVLCIAGYLVIFGERLVSTSRQAPIYMSECLAATVRHPTANGVRP